MVISTNAGGGVVPQGPGQPIEVLVGGQEDIDGIENGRAQFPRYREQNVVVTSKGTVVLVAQARNKSRWSDRSGQDLVCKTSTDSGRTWSRARLVVTHGNESICPNAAVYDRDTNRIHVLYNVFGWDYTRVPRDVRGELGDLSCSQHVATSDDEGRTWSAPRDISAMVVTGGAVMVVGSGEGIQLRHAKYRGRLIVAGGDFLKGKKVLCYYSDDHGETWERSSVVPHEGAMAWASESKVAELPDGTLVLNSRTFVKGDSRQRLRTRAFSTDGGTTWSTLENDPALKTVSCNGSLIALEHPGAQSGGVLLCSVPVGPGRTHGTVYASFDGGKTWPVKKCLVETAFAYSSLVSLPDGTIGLFYEARNHLDIRLVRFGLDWLLAAEGPQEARRPNVPPLTSKDQGPHLALSFEDAGAGSFDRLETSIGTWIPVVGRTIVDNKHARTGRQCLQLAGGNKTSVILRIADDVDTSGAMTFWAERWTRRAPFSFRIDKHTEKGWQGVFNGDKQIRVGRSFLSHVRVPLGEEGIKELRFTVSSPPNTGILIDDICIAPALPQEIVGVQVVPFSLPALVGVKASPILKLKIETKGQLNPISVTRLRVTLCGTTEGSDLTSVQVHHTRGNRDFSIGKPIARQEVGRSETGDFVLVCPEPACQLTEGENYVWVATELSRGADIDHRVGTSSAQVTFSNGATVKLDAPRSIQRMGVAVRKSGDDGVHTYRIPGLATTNKGTLIGVYDIRRRGRGDLPGDIDVGMSRSTDGGRTWEPMRVIMDMGDDPKWRYDGVGDPAVLVDRNTGTIWVAATWSHGNRSWRGSGPGMKPGETGQLMLTRSDDDGATWSKPINITEQVKRPEWSFILQGPGKGITMRDGTIVFAAQYQDPPEKKRLPHSTIIYSRDHGGTWTVGAGAFDDTTESQVVEIEPGVLMLNCRYNRNPTRVVMTTRDMGKTWQKHLTSERALIEPRACMASLIDVDREVGKDVGGWLLFSNPDSTRGRHHLTIKASPDRGLTWPGAHRLLLDEGNSYGYSCMSMVDEKTVGILYEGSQAHMTFQRIPLDEVTGKNAATRPGSK